MQEIKEIVRLGIEYGGLAVAALFVIAVVFLFGYFVIYKKLMKGTKQIRAKSLLSWGVFIAYIILIIGVTFGGRSWGLDNSFRYHFVPFYSYIEAWNSFSFTEWRNIILNIVAFAPLGFLIPICIKKCNRFYKVYGVALLFTVAIELVQLVTMLGIFEIDDILGNTVGAMIGYGFYSILKSIFKKNIRENWESLVALQIPLLVSVIAFLSIFVAYSNQELGNLKFYVTKASANSFSVENKAELDNTITELPVYLGKVYSHEEVREIAQNLLNKVGSEIDDKETMYYENTAFFHSKNNHIITVAYQGGKADYMDFNEDAAFEDSISENPNATETEIRNALKDIGVDLPKNMIFRNLKDGSYTFECEATSKDNLYTGQIRLSYNSNNVVYEYTNDITNLEEYKTFPVITEKEAYQQIENGMFYKSKGFDEITVQSVKLEYIADTKGFYQPVYYFDVLDNCEETVIMIPALKQ